MKLSDKLIDYISQVKSPFEEDDVTQEELEWDGYIRYIRDCMIQSIGTNESENLFKLYLDEFKDSCSDEQYSQFLDNCINKIIKRYGMSYLSFIIQQDEIDSLKKETLIKFIEFKDWLNTFVKCLSQIDIKIYKNDAKLRIFLDSDYDNFVKKLDSFKHTNELMKNYFNFCDGHEGRNALFNISKRDIASIVLQQYHLSLKKK